MIHNHPSANVEGLFIARNSRDFHSSPTDLLTLSLNPNGIIGDERHRGNTCLADIRTLAYRRKQDTVLNRQSVSLVSGEDLDEIATDLNLDATAIANAEEARALAGRPNCYDTLKLDYSWTDSDQRIVRRFLAQCLGANILLSDFEGTEQTPRFRDLTAGIDFGHYSENRKFENGVVTITRINKPCIDPGRKIQQLYPDSPPDLAKKFVVAAEGKRGFVGMVAMGGALLRDRRVNFIPFGER